MEVIYRPFDLVKRECDEETDPFKKMWRELELSSAHDMENEGIIVPVLNSLCPQIKPLSIREYVNKYWTGC